MATRKPFLLRIDPALWSELEAWAQDELRSVNGQIEYILKQAVTKRRGGTASAKPPEARKTTEKNDEFEFSPFLIPGRGTQVEKARRQLSQ